MRRKTTTLKNLLEKKNKPDKLPTSKDEAINFYANSDKIIELLNHSSDLIVEDIFIGNLQAKLFYLETICDTQMIVDQIQEPLLNLSPDKEEGFITDSKRELTKLFSGSKLSFSEEWLEASRKLVKGYALLVIKEASNLCLIHVKGVSTRSINEPTTQTIIRGPKDGFVEDISINLGIIRNRITNPNLCFRDYYIGEDTQTRIAVGYISNIVNDKLIKEVTERIEKIQTFAIFESANIEEMIEDKTYTPFPLIYNSERPDSVASHLVTGKIAIFVDGTPFVLTAPATFNDFFAVSEDYYQPFIMGSFLRIIRYFSFIISLLLPSFYVAIITYHHEMIPTTLITTIISQREGIPFPAVVEALIMEITFEILREAGIRMPRAVGQTVSIVGGLVIGQAAVEAGVVSNFMVIIVALTAIASFVSPVYNFAISTRLLRFIFIILGGSLGFFGVMIGLIMMIGHLNSLRSFGAPYVTPVSPFKWSDQEDIFVRLPYYMMKSRPSYLKTKKPIKQEADNSPTPPTSEDD
ncbi:spore germination protein [Sutcliffiella halmapala]|uniref:spore germination protein n=1 Tax=Sutcliffiella halmapala TaxID=79882 RepID=UPI0009955D53|nr:spore germination protein [Sutcliffiella halmapala]